MIGRYLTRMVLGRTLMALFCLAAMLQLLELFEKAGTIFAHGGLRDILHFIALRLPSLLGALLPIALLIGALLAFRGLAAGLEVTTLRAAGVSLGQMVRALLPLCLLLAALQFVLQNEVAPRADRAFADWWARIDPPAANAPPPPRLWLRAGPDLAGVDSVSADGRTVHGVELLRRGPSGAITARVTAASATLEPQGWVLEQASIAEPGKPEMRNDGHYLWPAGPSPANLVALARPVDSQTLGTLLATLQGRWVGGEGPSYYLTELYEALAAPLAPFVMLLLAAPVLLAPPRLGSNGFMTATSLALGLGYLVCAGLLDAFGESGTLPSWLAAWLVPLAFLAYAILRLMQADEA